MQKALIVFLTATTGALAVLGAVQWKQLRAARAQTLVAEQTSRAEAEAREAQAARVNELERNEALLERQLQEFTKVTTTLRANEARQSSNLTIFAERMRAGRPSGTNNEAEGGLFGKGMGEMLGKMMKDPSMREMMRDQQKAAINMMYSGLFKDLNLSPEEKDRLKQLLTDAQMRNIENAQDLMGGGDKDKAALAQKEIAEAKKQTDAEIKSLLGNERFAVYEDYQKNLNERMQIDQFKTQIASENISLRDDQTAGLLQIMKEEKTAVPPAFPTEQTQIPMKEQFTAKNMERQVQWMEDYNRRVLARAQGVLTPEQFRQYQTFQEQQTSMQKLSLSMARQMFGGEKSGDAGDTKPKK